jgi:hypothetical protein
MIRRAAALTLALTLTPAVLYAQDVALTVTVPSAEVHKGPSTVTPVIGHVARGKTLPVLRNLGSWAKVPWPEAADGIAYVHLTAGTLTSSNGAVAPAMTTAPAAAATAGPSVPARTVPATVAPAPAATHDRVVVRSQQGGAITHVLGVGAMVGPMSTFGGTARAWRDDRFGVQVGLTRDSVTGSGGAGRLTTFQVEPALVYRLFDRVSDYVWLRPYVGSGVSLRHQTLSDTANGPGTGTSSSGAGVRVFAGSEMTFAGAPKFALSVDFGYRRFAKSIAGFEPDRFAASLAGHWYVR